MGEKPMIKIENLTKRYGSKYALNGISFEVGKGEIVGFLGPNGAGKSTTMNILTGFLSYTDGKVEVDGLDILDFPEEAKRSIGYLPEQPPLYPEMTVTEYLNFVYDLKGCTLPRRAHINEILEVVKLTGYAKSTITNWCGKGRLKHFIKHNTYYIPKVFLIEFFCSPYFRSIIRKTSWHIQTINEFHHLMQKEQSK
jgi:ABC-type uncharacterized transport system ATPase subunit